MKVIIAGSRTIDPSTDLLYSLLSHFELSEGLTEIVSGTAGGVDKAGEQLADSLRYTTLKRFPADWNQYGKSAGYRRNTDMAEYADALLLIWDGKSKGSGHMKDIMNKLGKPIYEVILP